MTRDGGKKNVGDSSTSRPEDLGTRDKLLTTVAVTPIRQEVKNLTILRGIGAGR